MKQQQPKKRRRRKNCRLIRRENNGPITKRREREKNRIHWRDQLKRCVEKVHDLEGRALASDLLFYFLKKNTLEALEI
jgi:hypothetical protein